VQLGTQRAAKIFSVINFVNNYNVSGKGDQNIVCDIFDTKSSDSDKIWCTVSGINMLQNDANIFHLPWIMSLHYIFVKLEILITHIIPLSCYRKKLQNLFHLNCVLKVRQIWIQFITACGIIAREGVTNHAQLDWNLANLRPQSRWDRFWSFSITT